MFALKSPSSYVITAPACRSSNTSHSGQREAVKRFLPVQRYGCADRVMRGTAGSSFIPQTGFTVREGIRPSQPLSPPAPLQGAGRHSHSQPPQTAHRPGDVISTRELRCCVTEEETCRLEGKKRKGKERKSSLHKVVGLHCSHRWANHCDSPCRQRWILESWETCLFGHIPHPIPHRLCICILSPIRSGIMYHCFPSHIPLTSQGIPLTQKVDQPPV